LQNLEVIHELEEKRKIRINVTAMMSAQQWLLAAMSGATYVSLLGDNYPISRPVKMPAAVPCCWGK
jgi:hypothetical protein